MPSFPAVNCWAIFIRPLRGLFGQALFINHADKKVGVRRKSLVILTTLTFLSTFLLVTILGVQLLTRKSVEGG